MRRPNHPFWLFGILLVLPLGACELILGPDSKRVAGILRPDAQVVEIPDTGRVGEPVTVRIETGFYGGCSSKGETWVVREGALVSIRPYDFLTNLSGRDACILEASLYAHDVELNFDEPGVFTIRVVGSHGREGGTRVIEREIEIEPNAPHTDPRSIGGGTPDPAFPRDSGGWGS